MDNSKGYQVFKNTTSDPASPDGQDLIRKLLGESQIKSFPFSISGGDRSPDSHTVDCVIYITNGTLEIAFGENYSDKVNLEKNDLLFLAKDTPHLERAVGDRDVELTIYYTGTFSAVGVN